MGLKTGFQVQAVVPFCKSSKILQGRMVRAVGLSAEGTGIVSRDAVLQCDRRPAFDVVVGSSGARIRTTATLLFGTLDFGRIFMEDNKGL